MRVLVTGATGFVGTAVVNELLRKGHKVVGMTRSDEGAATLKKVGAEVVRGSTQDVEAAAAAAAKADGVIHLAFGKGDYQQASRDDEKLITAFADALKDSHKPLIVTSGTVVAKNHDGKSVTEDDPAQDPKVVIRSLTEVAMKKAVEKGVNAAAIRLPQVHDTKRMGIVTPLISIAKERGYLAVVDDGSFRWPAAHVTDVASCYVAALEKNKSDGPVYHAVTEEGVPMKDIIQALSKKLELDVKKITLEDAKDYYSRIQFAMQDIPASSAKTRSELNWAPKGPSILDDLAKFEV